MKRLVIAIAAVLVLTSTLIATASAAPKKLQPTSNNPFEGTFSGFVFGDRDSQAPMKIELKQNGNDIIGTIALGKGLYIDGGRCGGGYLPSTIQSAEGEVKDHEIEAETEVKVSGIKVVIELEGELSSDGETIEAEARVNIPWVCGPDPVISTVLVRDN